MGGIPGGGIIISLRECCFLVITANHHDHNVPSRVLVLHRYREGGGRVVVSPREYWPSKLLTSTRSRYTTADNTTLPVKA